MGFSGDLGDIGLNDVFHNISSNGLSGTLDIFNDRRRLYIYFDQGKLRMAASVAAGASSTPRAAVRRQKKRSRRNIRSLLNGDGPESEAFRKEVRDSILEEVYEAFAWTDSRFEFNDGAAPPNLFPLEQEEAAFDFEVQGVLMEAARRQDEWGRIHRQIRSFDEVYVQMPGIAEGEPPADALGAEVLALVDGHSDLDAIIANRSEGRFQICLALANLLRERWIRPLTIDERIDLANDLAAQGDRARAILLITSALEHERNEPTLHEKLGDLYTREERLDEAARAFTLAGSAFQTLGQHDEALSAYRRAVEVAPNDPPLRERLVNVLIERQDAELAVRNGLELAEQYTRLGLLDKARATFVRLRTVAPEDLDLAVQTARCERNLGNARDAIKILRSAATSALKRNEGEKGKAILAEILKIQPDHTEAKRLLGQVESGETEVKRERRKRARQLVAWGLGAGLIIYALSYEVLARSRLHAVQKENVALIKEGRFMDAVRNYDGLRAAYPWSLARIESGMMIEDLARGQLIDIEKQAPPGETKANISLLEQILTLAVAPDVYERARELLLRTRTEGRLLDLVDRLDDPERAADAHVTLAGFQDRNAVRVLIWLLGHQKAEVRVLALDALVKLKSYRAIPHVVDLLKDDEIRVRTRAGDALLVLTRNNTAETSYDYWAAWWKKHGKKRFEGR